MIDIHNSQSYFIQIWQSNYWWKYIGLFCTKKQVFNKKSLHMMVVTNTNETGTGKQSDNTGWRIKKSNLGEDRDLFRNPSYMSNLMRYLPYHCLIYPSSYMQRWTNTSCCTVTEQIHTSCITLATVTTQELNNSPFKYLQQWNLEH